MFVDIRALLATFVAAIGLALVTFALGAQVWIGHDRPVIDRANASIHTLPEPIERGLGASAANAQNAEPKKLMAIAAPTTPTLASAPQVTSTQVASTPATSSENGSGGVVEDRFAVLAEPSAEVVPPRGGATRSAAPPIGGPLVPLPRPRMADRPATATTPVSADAETSLVPPAAIPSKRDNNANGNNNPPKKRNASREPSRFSTFGGWFNR